jgi:hypothetical protein
MFKLFFLKILVVKVGGWGLGVVIRLPLPEKIKK